LDYAAAVRLALKNLETGQVQTAWTDSVSSSQGDRSPVVLTSREGIILERRELTVSASPAALFESFASLGGEAGWLYMDWAWEVRGWVDRLLGGVGLRRGRRHPVELRAGDALDFWRVEAVEPGRLLRLRAEMKVPGRAWLEFRVEPGQGEQSILSQTAFFAPRGLSGWLYWHLLYPIHSFIFSGLIRRIAARAAGA
jgi:hypothetical protein